MTLAPLPVGPIGEVLFLGTPAEAAVVLRHLVGDGIRVVAAVTRPDARRGRGSARTPSPVAATADGLGIPVMYDHAEALAAHPGVLGVVVAYGRVFDASTVARHGLVNLHFSMLPRWRGAAPVERALLAGDTETGVCLMRIASGLDEGDLFACESVAIGPDESAADLRARLAAIGARLVARELTAGLGEPRPQSGAATYAHKLTASDRTIRWEESAELALRRVRVGPARATVGGHELRVLAARVGEGLGEPGAVRLVGRDAVAVECAEGALELLEVQPPGGTPMRATDWLRGRR